MEASTDFPNSVILGYLQNLDEGGLPSVCEPDRETISKDRENERVEDFSPVREADASYGVT
jgi:hypothetical protein